MYQGDYTVVGKVRGALETLTGALDEGLDIYSFLNNTGVSNYSRMYKKRACYGYMIQTGEFFSSESIYKAIVKIKGEYKVSWCRNVLKSMETPANRKYSALGAVWFDMKEGICIVKPNEITCALTHRYININHGNDINWGVLRKAQEASRCPIIAYNDCGEEILYPSIAAAAEDFGTSSSNICRVLTNQNKGSDNHHLGKKRLSAAGWYFRRG